MSFLPVRFSAAQLVDDRADVVLGFPDGASTSDQALARELLDEEERERAARFVFDRDRGLYVFSHGLLRLVLAHYLHASAKDIRFACTPEGRPEIDANGTPPIRFNLSHTDGLVACIVTRSAACGVDVESLGRIDYRGLMAKVLSSAETTALTPLDEAAQRERFLEIWALKEAFLKGQGLGILHPLRGISFSGFDGERRCDTEPDHHGAANANRPNDPNANTDDDTSHGIDDGNAWRFWSAKPTARHFAAAAIRTGGAVATFSITKAGPLA